MNDTILLIITIYILAINLAGFISMALDKHFAVKHMWRIPEKTLFMIALLGGSIGSNVGMQVCRHKTKHWYFVIFMPLILIVQVGAVVYYFVK